MLPVARKYFIAPRRILFFFPKHERTLHFPFEILPSVTPQGFSLPHCRCNFISMFNPPQAPWHTSELIFAPLFHRDCRLSTSLIETSQKKNIPHREMMARAVVRCVPLSHEDYATISLNPLRTTPQSTFL
jgi:hypothetical protein